MWNSLAQFILKYRLFLLIALLSLTAVMSFFASKVELSYDFSKAIPEQNSKYKEYLSFKKKFGDDANTVVIGITATKFYTPAIFNASSTLEKNIKRIAGVEDVLSIPEASELVRNDSAEKLQSQKIFHLPYNSQVLLDSDRHAFENLPFYAGRLYNLNAHAYLIAARLNKDTINSKGRTRLIKNIIQQIDDFKQQTGLQVYISGLPFIRTSVANRIAKEMNWFLTGSFILSALTLLLFFRSWYATIMSLLVVGMGVIFSLATIVLLGYKITLLTALIPPLIVVIGVPNCIYFLNKYHTGYKDTGDKHTALITMISRMSIVTLFCNIAAAIGFAVFALTQSALLKEFGIVSGINIMLLFIISVIFIPSVLSYLPPPTKTQMKYLDTAFLKNILGKIEYWAFNKSIWIYAITLIAIIISAAGILKLKSEGFIVDDLPKNDKIYTDLKWFEKNFNGIMPLEITVDTKKKNGLTRNTDAINNIDIFSQYIAAQPEAAKPLSFVDGLKFAKQAYYEGDSVDYAVPSEFDFPLMRKYLITNKKDSSKNALNKMLNSFIDSNKQVARISVNMKDIGSVKLPVLLHHIDSFASSVFDTSYKVSYTGSSITFLEGITYIINGLKQSIFWAFILIALCMLYLFRSVKILLCSLIPNTIPLIITAGVMGWAGIALKPSTVLIFSVALGIVIDVTIRFLINYRQEFANNNYNADETLKQTIRHTGISILYTSLVLIAGFVIFCFSNFGGTKALGWLTSLTLVTGTLTNLILLPALMRTLAKKNKNKIL